MSKNEQTKPQTVSQASSEPEVVDLSFVEFVEVPMRLNQNYSTTMLSVEYIRLHLQPWVHVRLKNETATEFVIPISNVRSIKVK